MKRFLASILALSMLISLAAFTGTAFAEGEEARVAVDFPETYSSGDIINIVLSFDDVVEEFGEGISAVGFEFHYDNTKVSPVVKASADDDGDNFVFTSLITEAPDNWEGYGRIYGKEGYYDLAFTEDDATNLVDENNRLVITLPFRVSDDAKVDSLFFRLKNAVIYGADMNDYKELRNESIFVEYALQPSEKTQIPEGTLPLEVAGYRHEAKNVIYYAFRQITVGDYIKSFIEITNNQQDMNYFGIIVVGSDNVITYVDTVIGRPQSDKSAVVIPAGSYIIGVNGNKTSDLETFKKIARVGSTVELYNVNLEATGMVETGTDLTDAAFGITSSTLNIKEDAPMVYSEMESVVRLYISSVDIDDFKAMFETDITVLDKDGNEVTSGFVKTGMTIDFANGVKILVMGDCNSDGKVTAQDYARMKRHILGTLTLEGDQYLASLIRGDEKLSARDYAVVKRFVLKTIKITNYMPK